MDKIIKQELIYFGIFVILFYAFFQIYYHNDRIWNIMKLAMGHFYLYIVPGYCLMLYYLKKLDFITRLIIGAGLGYAVTGFVSYFLLIALHVNILKSYLFIPPVAILLGFFLGYRAFKTPAETLSSGANKQ